MQNTEIDEDRLKEEKLREGYAFFQMHKKSIMQSIDSNHLGVKRMYQKIELLISNGLQDITDLIEFDNALTKINAYIIVGFLNAVEDYDLELKYVTRIPSLAFKTNLNKLKIIQHLKINADDCYINQLPSEIGLMQQLKSLEMSDCLIKKLPKEIGFLTNLQILDLDGDPIVQLPKEIGNLSSLKELYIGNNPQLTELPDEIGELGALEILQAAHDSLKVLPDALARLVSLRELNFSFNQLQDIPATLAKLPHLKVLKIDHNQIKIIPTELSKLIH